MSSTSSLGNSRKSSREEGDGRADEAAIMVGMLTKQPRSRSTTSKFYKGGAKKRLFRLTTHHLQYFEAKDVRKTHLKGEIEVRTIRIVETVNDSEFGKYSFQVGSSKDMLYLTASSEHERKQWMFEVRFVCHRQNNPMAACFHPGTQDSNNRWSCCRGLSNNPGCAQSYAYGETTRSLEDLDDSPDKDNASLRRRLTGIDERLSKLGQSKDDGWAGAVESTNLADRSMTMGDIDQKPESHNDNEDSSDGRQRFSTIAVTSVPSGDKLSGQTSGSLCPNIGHEINPFQASMKRLSAISAASPKKNPFGDLLNEDGETNNSTPADGKSDSAFDDSGSKFAEPSLPRQNSFFTKAGKDQIDTDGWTAFPDDGSTAENGTVQGTGDTAIVFNDSLFSPSPSWPSQSPTVQVSPPTKDAPPHVLISPPPKTSTLRSGAYSKTSLGKDIVSSPSTDELSSAQDLSTSSSRSASCTDLSSAKPTSGKSQEPEPVGAVLTGPYISLDDSDEDAGLLRQDSRTTSLGNAEKVPKIEASSRSSPPPKPRRTTFSTTQLDFWQRLPGKKNLSSPAMTLPHGLNSKHNPGKKSVSSPSSLPRHLESSLMGQGSGEWRSSFEMVDEVDCRLSIDGGGLTAVEEVTSLHSACQQGLVDEVQRLLEEGANPDEPDRESRKPPLFLAYFSDHIEVLRILILNGAEPNMTLSGSTLLHKAAESNNSNVATLLLQHGALTHIQDWQYNTPLHLASKKGHTSIVELLLDSGAEVNAETDEKRTALHLASIEGHQEVINVLIERGVSVSSRDKYSFSAQDLALKSGEKEVAKFLRQHMPNSGQMFTCTRSFRPHRKDTSALCFSPAGDLITGSHDTRVCVWNISGSEGGDPTYCTRLGNTILSIAFHNDFDSNTSLLAVGAGCVHVFDLKRAGWRAVLLDSSGNNKTQDDQLYLVAFTPTGQLATAGVEKGTQIDIWDVMAPADGFTHQPVLSITADQEGPGAIHNLKISPSQSPLLAVSIQPGADRLHPKGNNIIHCFNWSTGLHLFRIDTGFMEMAGDLSLAFSPSGRYISTGSGSSAVSVWAAANGLLLSRHQLPNDDPVFCVEFSPDGQHLAVGGESGAVQLIAVSDGTPSFLPEGCEKPATSVAFSMLGTTLAVGYEDGTVKVWEAPSRRSMMLGGDVDVQSSYEYSRAVSSSGEISEETEEFLKRLFANYESATPGVLGKEDLSAYFSTFLDTQLSPEMFAEVKEKFSSDQNIEGLTADDFTRMAFCHFCQQPHSMWSLWLENGYPPQI